jgi:CRISPR/Cas system CMR-associated protein Cmr5 small subunit
MAIQTLDQQVAALAHGSFDRLKTTVKKTELPGYIKKTATRLRVSGLGVTVAFCLKDKEDLAPIAKELATILAALKLPKIKTGDAESLLVAYTSSSAAEIRRLQTYAEHALEWLAKWADTYKA